MCCEFGQFLDYKGFFLFKDVGGSVKSILVLKDKIKIQSMTREHVVISFDAVFKKVSRTDADRHRQHRPIPNCVAGFCFDPFYTA